MKIIIGIYFFIMMHSCSFVGENAKAQEIIAKYQCIIGENHLDSRSIESINLEFDLLDEEGELTSRKTICCFPSDNYYGYFKGSTGGNTFERLMKDSTCVEVSSGVKKKCYTFDISATSMLLRFFPLIGENSYNEVRFLDFLITREGKFNRILVDYDTGFKKEIKDTMYFNAESNLLIKVCSNTGVVIEYSDYIKYDGVLFPTVTLVKQIGQEKIGQKVIIKNVSLNKSCVDSLYNLVGAPAVRDL